MIGFTEVADGAFNAYLDNYRIHEELDWALAELDGHIYTEVVEPSDTNSWESYLDSPAITLILTQLTKRAKNDPMRDPIHTFLLDKIYVLLEEHGEEKFAEWEAIIDTMYT